MMLVDTSVWVDHLRRGNARLAAHLDRAIVLAHPHVIGELACGSLRRRGEVLEHLRALPIAATAEDDELLEFVAAERLWGRGLGWIDVHLLASARLSSVELWTLDRRLAEAAKDLGVGH